MARIILHIGQPKTATTTIQSFLFANAAALAARGWLYPAAGRQHLAHHLLGNWFRPEPMHWIGPSDPAAVVAALEREIDQTGCHSVILSSESLYFTPEPARLRGCLAGHEVRIVLFLRRQDEWIDSAFQENLKNGEIAIGPQRYLDAQAAFLDYAARIDTWADAFGADRIIVIPFEKAAVPLPVEDQFLAVIGAASCTGLHHPPAENDRLCRDAIAFLTHFEARPRVSGRHQMIKDLLAEYSRAHPDPAPLRHVFSPAERLRILQTHAEGNARIARDYLGRADGVLFAAPPPAPDEPWQVYPGLDPAVAARMAEHVMGRMHDFILAARQG